MESRTATGERFAAVAIGQELARCGFDARWLARETQWEHAYVTRVLAGVLPGCPAFFAAARRALGMTAGIGR